MAVRRWVNLARYDNAEMLIATDCPPDRRNCLVVRNYHRSDLSQFGFQKLSDGLWLGGSASFKTSDLIAWFPGFDPKRDISDFDVSSFLIGYEDLDLQDADAQLDALVAKDPEQTGIPSFREQMAVLRAGVPAEEIDAIAAAFPEESTSEDDGGAIAPELLERYLRDIGALDQDPAQRQEYLFKHAEQLRAELVQDTTRYNELRTRRLDAISDYDIGVAFAGDALHALRGNLHTKRSLIDLHRRRLTMLRQAIADLDPLWQSPSHDTTRSKPAEPITRERRSKNPERIKERIEDAGEKIGGARKDFYAKSLSSQDLEGMNDRELTELVTKDNIWPSKSLQEYREAGVDARVALFVQTMRRDLMGGIKSASDAPAYVDFVSRLRDAASKLKSIEDVRNFEESVIECGIILRQKRSYSTSIEVAPEFKDVVHSDPKGWTFIGKYCIQPLQGYSKAKYRYETHRYKFDDEWILPRDLDSDGFYGFLEKMKQRANERRQRTLANKSDDNENKKDLTSRPHLANIVRSGLPDERNGRNIGPDDFLSDFGFRAVEFGNWLPQDERQDVLNRAYDALSTLARVLGVGKRFLSLGGTLAVGFGSRGIGRFAAHYEPARKVINLTRLNGAGALAHEFFHALDDRLGELVKSVLSDPHLIRSTTMNTDTYYSTELFLTKLRVRRGLVKNNTIAQSGYLPASMPHLRPIVHLVSSFSMRPFTDAEIRTATEGKLASEWYLLKNHVRDFLQIVHEKSSQSECNEMAENLIVKLRQEFADTTMSALPEMRFGEKHPLAGYLASLPVGRILSGREQFRHRDGLSKIDQMLKRMVGLQKMLIDDHPLALSNSEYAGKMTYTKYFKDAEHFDAGKSKKYWSSVRELAARAFESYVQDKCADEGWRDDYLVHGAEEERFEEALHSPYPVGADRRAIAEAFGPFIALIRDELSPENAHTESPKLQVA